MILDSSAVLAYMYRETGWQYVENTLLDQTLLSAVNAAEVLIVLTRKQGALARSWQQLEALNVSIEPFTRQQSIETARLVPATQGYGLSLGDRACLALALERQMPVLTGDRIWQTLDIGVRVEIFR